MRWGGHADFDQQAPTERLTRSVGSSDDVRRKCVCPRTRRATRSQASTGNTLPTIPKKKDLESDNPVPASGDLIELYSPTTYHSRRGANIISENDGSETF